MKRTIAGRTFEKIGDNYSFHFSKRHYILAVRMSKGWEARENRIPSSGSWIEGTKEVKMIRKAQASTLNQAVSDLIKMMEQEA